MHRLKRCVRFSVNPFLERTVEGANPFASKPAGEGLAVFLELLVEVAGPVEPATGLLVNVTEIDRQVREAVVPWAWLLWPSCCGGPGRSWPGPSARRSWGG